MYLYTVDKERAYLNGYHLLYSNNVNRFLAIIGNILYIFLEIYIYFVEFAFTSYLECGFKW